MNGEIEVSLYQCEHCGCLENTAPGMQPKTPEKWFDWTEIEDRKGKHLCSMCGPTKYKGGERTDYGVWHGMFPRYFLPIGEFRTNREGNLEHIKTGRTDWKSFVLRQE